MKAFVNHFSFELRTGIRDRSLLLMNYLFPLGFYAMIGMLMTELNPTFSETMIPAMVIFAVLSSMILGLPNPLISAREAGIFRSYKINGVPAISILAIPALTTILHMILVAAVITVTAPLFFGAPAPISWAAFLLVLLVTAFAYAGLGALIGVISSNTRSSVLWSQLIFLPSMILGGLMIPSAMLPETLGKVATLLPSTYAMQAFQGLAYNQNTAFGPLWSLIILLASGMLSFMLAIYLFNWDKHSATRHRHSLLALLALLPYVVGLLLF